MYNSTLIKKIALYSLLLPSTLYTMENKPMIRIHRWEDVTDFAGYITAYKTDVPSLGHNRGFTKHDPAIKYAYISKKYFPLRYCYGYQLHQLLKIEEIPLFDRTYGDVFITDTSIKNSFLYMRKIDSYELMYILTALKTNNAQFAYFDFYRNELMPYMESIGAQLLEPDKKTPDKKTVAAKL